MKIKALVAVLALAGGLTAWSSAAAADPKTPAPVPAERQPTATPKPMPAKPSVVQPSYTG